MNKTTKKEFIETRTSWKWLERYVSKKKMFEVSAQSRIQFLVLLEILKELQYLNDHSK